MLRPSVRMAWLVALGVIVFVAIAVPTYGLVVYGGVAAFARFYPGSGHPPLPGAPDWMYGALLFGVGPVVALGAAAWITRAAVRIARRAFGSAPPGRLPTR